MAKDSPNGKLGSLLNKYLLLHVTGWWYDLIQTHILNEAMQLLIKLKDMEVED